MAAQEGTKAGAKEGPAHGEYVVPLVHLRLPEPVVDAGFYGLLAGTALFGVIDAPLAILLGLGIAVARHRTRR